MWAPVSRAGDRPFFPEDLQQSCNPDTPSLWLWPVEALHHPQGLPHLQPSAGVCPGAQCPDPPGPLSLMGEHSRRGGCHGHLHGEPGRTPCICGGQNFQCIPACCQQPGALGFLFWCHSLVEHGEAPGIPARLGEAGGCVQMLLCAHVVGLSISDNFQLQGLCPGLC